MKLRLKHVWELFCAGLRDPLRRRTFFILFVTIGGLWAIIVGSYLYASYLSDRDDLKADRAQYVDERSDNLTTSVISRISDIFLLPGLPMLSAFLELPNAVTRGPVETFLTTVAARDRDVDDIRILDPSGKELLRVSKSGDDVTAAPASELQDISDRYYVREAANLLPNSFYISPLDLDVEYGEIEVPWEPTLRIAAPLFNSQGLRLGLVLINVNFGTLLKTFVPNYRDGTETTLLLNGGGYILAGASDELLWGFMFPNGPSFARGAPEIWNKISGLDGGQFQLDGDLVTFRTISPLRLMRDQFSFRGVNFVGTVGSWKIVDVQTVSFDATVLNAPTIAVMIAGLLMVLVTSWIFSRYPAERTQFLARQRVQEFRINSLLDNTSISIIVRDMAGRFVFANAEFCRLFGRTREEFVGRKVREVLPPHVADSIEASDDELAAGLPRLQFEQPVTMPDGRRRVLLIHKFILSDEEGNRESICGVTVDVTELKAAEEALREAKDAAEMASRAKSDFLAAMSHEIRTPLNGVIGMVDLLRDSSLSQDQQTMVTTIRESAQTLLGIIGDILDFSKLEAGRMTLDVGPVSVCEIVEAVMHALCGLGYAKGLMMPLFCDPEIPALVRADPIRLRQILYNLLGNAVKFTESTSGRRGQIVFRADVVDRAPGQVKIRYSVADNGIGIDDDTKSRLFRPFEQGERSAARRYEGTGLGLSICRQLAEMMDGELSVVSAMGLGSNFTFEVWHEIVEQGAPPFDLSGKHILFVGPRATAWIASYLSRYVSHCGGAMDWVQALDDAPERLMAALSVGRPFDVLLVGAAAANEVKAALRDRLHATPGLESLRYIFMNQTVAEAPRVIDDLTVSVSGRPLCRSVILPAIAIACGRASPRTLSIAKGEPARTAAPQSVEEAVEAGQLILIAEDNAINRDVLRRQIATLGYAAEMAANGAEALAMLQSRHYALLLTDCHMPQMDGYELTRRIRAAEAKNGAPRLPIIAITANALHGEAERCLEVGMDDYLSKPIDLPSFRVKLRQWMPTAPTTKPIRTPLTDNPQAAGAREAFDPTTLPRFMGNSEAVFGILGDFCDSARNILVEIERALYDRSAAGVAMAAHKLKSSSRTVGAAVVASTAERLERAGKAEIWSEIESANRDLGEALAVALNLIDAHIEGAKRETADKVRT